MRTVLLMTDHSGFPLRDEEGGTGPEDWVMLSPDLMADLEAWEHYWARHFHWKRGWRTGARGWYVQEGHRLAAQLQDELGQGWAVQRVLG